MVHTIGESLDNVGLQKVSTLDYNSNGHYQYSKPTNTLIFYVNGKEVVDENVDPEWTLLYYLRNKLKLCGTKLGCAEGGCGACTVMISKCDRKKGKLLHLAVNACLTPVCAMHGLAVTTVEGIGSTRTKLHPVQERIAKAHGSQCGFCTPGIVMSMYALLRTISVPTMENLEVAFQGNLCRCTGYRPIIEGLKTFTEEWEQSQRLYNINNGNSYNENKTCAMGDACCKKIITSEPTEVFDAKEFRPYDSTQEPIFPPKLQLSSALDQDYLIIKGKNVVWYRPTTFQEMLVLKNRHPNAKIIVGNTEVGVETKFKHMTYSVLINSTQIDEMTQIVETQEGLEIGASVTLMEIEETLKEKMKSLPESKVRIFHGIVNMLHWFAGKQIRNVAAVGGNIMTGSPISDLNPIFMAAGVKLNVYSLKRGHRKVPMDHTFFVGYRRNVLESDEFLKSIEIPYSVENQYFVAYKQAKRRDDDIAIVNMALNVFFEPGTITVKKCYIAYGGMAPVTKLATETCAAIVGKEWNDHLLDLVCKSLTKELPLAGDAPGGMVKYRRTLTLSLFFKAFIAVAKQIQLDSPNLVKIPKEVETASNEFRHTSLKSSQYYQVVPKEQDVEDLIGRPIVHTSALKQTTGEALYCDDIPPVVGELYLSLVLSTRTHAKIINIDPSKALNLDGVVAYFDAKDIPDDCRYVGYIAIDDQIFVSNKVTSQGQPIGAVVAVDQATAQKAARMVQVEYQDLEPVIITIEDAIREQSFHTGCQRQIIKGDSEKAFAGSDHVIEGDLRIGGQEHFYLETHACIAIPREDSELEIICSTQSVLNIQAFTAQALQIPMNKINVRTKRLGGGFGGKECRGMLIYVPVALAAHRLRKPVRCMLDRDEDMMITGGRHPFLFRYKVGFNKNGLINVLQLYIYNNAGYSVDLSSDVIERAMFHCTNTYKIPVVDIRGFVCKTNLPSNTAYRGFGAPQAMLMAETFMRQIADYLGRDVIQIAEMNMYTEGDSTHFNQQLIGCTLQRCWQECFVFSNYKNRLNDVQRFNRENKHRKRGLAIVPTIYGIGFNSVTLNQGAALVHIYTDGSVALFHGGIEMGQGLHTKMIQVASRVLKVNPAKIHTLETATDKVPNTTSTAASTGSDLNGMAVVDACSKIMNRIKHIINANPKGTWESWIKEAYTERISLSATGFYKVPDIGYSFDTNSGNPYSYFTYGAGCSEVEIDCLTGDHRVLRADIVMDIGESLNPAIDVGQIEGAFTQGYGLFTLEELMYSPSGTLLTRGPGTYKIPSFTDIPQEFNVSLLKGNSNPKAVFSSKAVGEPPLFMSASVFFAIKNAIKSAREDVGIFKHFRLDAPATAARIRMACVDNLTQQVSEDDGKKAWNIIP